MDTRSLKWTIIILSYHHSPLTVKTHLIYTRTISLPKPYNFQHLLHLHSVCPSLNFSYLRNLLPTSYGKLFTDSNFVKTHNCTLAANTWAAFVATVQNGQSIWYLDTMIVKISDDNISTQRRHSTEMWTGEVTRVRGTTRSKLVNDAAIWLENIHGTATVVDDDNTTVWVAADTLWTKQLACTDPEQQHNTHHRKKSFHTHTYTHIYIYKQRLPSNLRSTTHECTHGHFWWHDKDD